MSAWAYAEARRSVVNAAAWAKLDLLTGCSDSDEKVDKAEDPVASFPSLPSLLESVEKNAHDLATEILTILFPSPKHLWVGELSESMRGLIC